MSELHFVETVFHLILGFGYLAALGYPLVKLTLPKDYYQPYGRLLVYPVGYLMLCLGGFSLSGSTGMSDSMSPGDIADLSRSSELAFRAMFEETVPSKSQLYWRATTLSFFDGRQWNTKAEALRDDDTLGYLDGMESSHMTTLLRLFPMTLILIQVTSVHTYSRITIVGDSI